MTIGREILVRRTVSYEHNWCKALRGDVWHLLLHGTEYSPALRSKPPRVRLLEDQADPLTRCELLDEWPDAPPEWPTPAIFKSGGAPVPVPAPAPSRGRRKAG